MAQNARNTMALINSNTIKTWYSVVKLILKLTYLDLKQDRENHVLIPSSVLCYNLAKQLSHYLYFFSFGLITYKKYRKVLYHKCHIVTVT